MQPPQRKGPPGPPIDPQAAPAVIPARAAQMQDSQERAKLRAGLREVMLPGVEAGAAPEMPAQAAPPTPPTAGGPPAPAEPPVANDDDGDPIAGLAATLGERSPFPHGEIDLRDDFAQEFGVGLPVVRRRGPVRTPYFIAAPAAGAPAAPEPAAPEPPAAAGLAPSAPGVGGEKKG